MTDATEPPPPPSADPPLGPPPALYDEPMPSPRRSTRHSDRSSRHSHSRSRSSRSGSRRRSSRRRHRHRRGLPKITERNLLGAVCSMMAIVGTCTALAEGQWFTFHGGQCNDGKQYLHSTGASTFMFPGQMERSNDTEIYKYSYYGDSMILQNCVNGPTVAVMRSILTLSIIAIILALVAFIMDLIGPSKRFLMVVRRNGVLNIVCLFVLVIVLGLAHYAATLIKEVQLAHKRAKGSKVEIYFGISYYIVVGAAVANILATACNLLRRYHPIDPPTRQEDQTPILRDISELDDIIRASQQNLSQDPPPNLNEPPPYTP